MTGNGTNDATAAGSLLIELLGALPPFLWFGPWSDGKVGNASA